MRDLFNGVPQSKMLESIFASDASPMEVQTVKTTVI